MSIWLLILVRGGEGVRICDGERTIEGKSDYYWEFWRYCKCYYEREREMGRRGRTGNKELLNVL